MESGAIRNSFWENVKSIVHGLNTFDSVYPYYGDRKTTYVFTDKNYVWLNSVVDYEEKLMNDYIKECTPY